MSRLSRAALLSVGGTIGAWLFQEFLQDDLTCLKCPKSSSHQVSMDWFNGKHAENPYIFDGKNIWFQVTIFPPIHGFRFQWIRLTTVLLFPEILLQMSKSIFRLWDDVGFNTFRISGLQASWWTSACGERTHKHGCGDLFNRKSRKINRIWGKKTQPTWGFGWDISTNTLW